MRERLIYCFMQGNPSQANHFLFSEASRVWSIDPRHQWCSSLLSALDFIYRCQTRMKHCDPPSYHLGLVCIQPNLIDFPPYSQAPFLLSSLPTELRSSCYPHFPWSLSTASYYRRRCCKSFKFLQLVGHTFTTLRHVIPVSWVPLAAYDCS